MFSDTIKKMALKQLAEWMDKEGISEVKIWPDEKGEILLMEAKHPHRFIHTSEIDERIKAYQQEFSRLRELIRSKDDELFSLRVQIAKLKDQ